MSHQELVLVFGSEGLEEGGRLGFRGKQQHFVDELRYLQLLHVPSLKAACVIRQHSHEHVHGLLGRHVAQLVSCNISG